MAVRSCSNGCGDSIHSDLTVAVAGTFNVLHKGHRALLDKALSFNGKLLIGITSDKMASSERKNVVPFYIRKKSIEDYLKLKDRTAEIYEINDIYGPIEMDNADILVVSEETKRNGEIVVSSRIEKGKKPLSLVVVPIVESSIGEKISSTGILEGRYSRNGNVISKKIVVGSMNHVKIEAVRNVMEKIYGDVIVIGRDVPSGVPEQPFGEETYQGAVNRAKNAFGDCDLSVGIEAGVFELYGELIDIQHCAILDSNNKITIGMGSGFAYPKDIADAVRSGMTVGNAVDSIYSKTSVGHSEGAVGILTNGLMDRRELTEQSVMAAMIPRIK